MKELLEKAQDSRGGEDVGLPKSLSFLFFMIFFSLGLGFYLGFRVLFEGFFF